MPHTAPQSSMRGMAIIDGGLQLIAAPIPVPQPGHVLIQIAYAGVNRADLLQVAGKYPPPEGASALPGLEVSGIVAALGEGVTDWRVGERVCALLSGGGYAEFASAPEGLCLKIPQAIDLQQAATLPEAVMTAMMALGAEANLQPGERVLIHGGSSGIGLVMGQVAMLWGAEVFATVGSDEKAAYVSQLGIHPINHALSPFLEQVMAATRGDGVDVIIDTLGAPKLSAHLQLLKRGGRIVMLAMLEGGTLPEATKLGALLLKHLQLRGTTLRSRNDIEKHALMEGVSARIWPYVASGALKPRVDSIFPLAEAEKAHLRMQERLHIGKILLEVAPHAARTDE
ncbi:MAG: hypothetical protein B7X02_00965 [Rhodospirillales bacterium 12-54-5]|nr:MAG: hypothetical protein B7X02_00965 [Rhodospirillales bacterium 12-54-5]